MGARRAVPPAGEGVLITGAGYGRPSGSATIWVRAGWGEAETQTRVARDDWLLEAAELPEGGKLTLYPRGDVTKQAAYGALKARFGEYAFDTAEHRDVLYVVRGRVFADGTIWDKRCAAANLGCSETAALSKEELAALQAEAREAGAKYEELAALWGK